jgi:hypothetical protein
LLSLSVSYIALKVFKESQGFLCLSNLAFLIIVSELEKEFPAFLIERVSA